MPLSPAPLPSPLSSFVGREHELADLDALFMQARLISLVGAGGCGKTRLALASVARQVPLFADGIAFADLSPLNTPDLLAPTLLRALGLREQADRAPLELLAAALHEQRLLLILDNAEHVLNACARLAGQLLAACPGVTILVTSREHLALRGEQIYPVAPLSVSHTSTPAEAEQLFLARARSRRPQLTPSPDQAAQIGEICRQLDGLPLAVELAAARVAALSIAQISARLAERFQLLISSERDTVAGHRSLQAALDWSYDLLEEDEQAAFLRASVFPGGFTLAGAEAVIAGAGIAPEAVPNLLQRLVDQSLIESDTGGVEARYRLLEAVRVYGRERLAERDETAAALGRHAEYVLALVESGTALALTQARYAWLGSLEQQIDDFRQAMRWLLDARATENALRLAAALLQLCWVRGYMSEGRGWLRAALALPGPVEARTRAAALRAEGQLAHAQGDFAVALPALQESVALHDELEEDRAGHAPRVMLGAVTHADGNLAEARSLYEESLAGLERVGFALAAAAQRDRLAEIARREGQLAAAWRYIQRSLRTRADLGARAGVAEGLATAGMIAASARKPEAAARLLGAAEARRQQMGMALLCFYQDEHTRIVAALRSRLGAKRLALYWEQGAALTQEAALALVEQPLGEPRSGVDGPRAPRGIDLSEREREVLRLVAADRSNKEIALKLGLSVRTVEQHLRSVYGKLGVQGRAGAAAEALRLGLVGATEPSDWPSTA